MKVSIFIKNTSGWYAKELKKEARKRKIELDFLEIKNLNNLNELNNDIGNVVFWRSANIDKYCDKNIVLSFLEERGAQIVNLSNLKKPFIIQKLYQQKMLEGRDFVQTITTFNFSSKKELIIAIKNKDIKFPFIGKPNLGSKGEGVYLLKSQEDVSKLKIDIKGYVFQNYIENDGDYRILVLGGKALGIIKRIASEGGFLNNISQGGRSEKVFDKEVVNQLTNIAERIASKFELNFCGVDVIKDKKTGEYYFLELNTAPQWQGFQRETGINVSGELLDYFRHLCGRKKGKTYNLVKKYYKDNYPYLLDKKFHYVSRIFLWSNKRQFISWMNDLKTEYYGRNREDAINKIKKKIKWKSDFSRINFSKIRKPLLRKYENLSSYSKVLFFFLFSKTLYNQDLKEDVLKIIDKKELIKISKELHKNPEDIFILATHATNFLYILEELLDKKVTKPRFYLKILKKYAGKSLEKEANLTFAIYFATHCIIGESRFYSRKVTKNKRIYIKMLKYVEEIIANNFFKIKLDCKLEFIVCCRILGIDTYLEKVIKNEADNSVSSMGNFLIDKFNLNNESEKNLSLRDSEHRNVLYLMAFSNYEK